MVSSDVNWRNRARRQLDGRLQKSQRPLAAMLWAEAVAVLDSCASAFESSSARENYPLRNMILAMLSHLDVVVVLLQSRSIALGVAETLGQHCLKRTKR